MDPNAATLLNRLLSRGKFRHLQVLLSLAELGSVQRTADAIGLTQSAVTQILAYLERLVDMPLFERHARGVRPTDACHDLLPIAHNLLGTLAQGAEALAASAQRGEGVVRVAASQAALSGLLSYSLPSFFDEHPGITVMLREAEGADQRLLIGAKEVDLVVCRRAPVIPEGWDFQALEEDRMSILCCSSHPLAKSQHLTSAELASHAWLLLPADSPSRVYFEELIRDLPKPRIHPIVTRSLSTIWWMMRQSRLLGFFPVSLARHWIGTGELVELHLPDVPEVRLDPLGLLLPQAAISAATRALCSHISGRSQECSFRMPAIP